VHQVGDQTKAKERPLFLGCTACNLVIILSYPGS